MGMKLNRGAVSREIVSAAGLQAGTDVAPNEFEDKLRAVVIVNDVLDKFLVSSSTRTTTTAGATQFTVPSTDRFFLTSISLHNQSDATADNILISLNATPKEGPNLSVIRIGKLTTTAGTRDIIKTFNPPLELEQGSAIVLINAFTVGASTTQTQTFGFVREAERV